jgi:hypothetical protein
MNVLYKYCDQLGIVKILESLELKLPYISQVNDPLECLPFVYCPNDNAAIEALYLSALKRRGMPPSADYKQKLENGKIPKIFEDGMRDFIRDWNQRNCLLSVSKTAQSTVMWAHYVDKHKGAVIGIDFNKILPKCGIKMHLVDYSEQRPKMNCLDEFTLEKSRETVLTKSVDWSYEKEFRAVFRDAYLMSLERKDLACLKDFNDRKTWFLRLNPESIREVIFGLYAENSLKLAISKLVERQELQHVRLYQAEESETYTLNLVELKNR